MTYDEKTRRITTDGDFSKLLSDTAAFFKDVEADVAKELEKRRKQKNRLWRVWFAASGAWAVCVVVFVVLVQPYGSYFSDEEALRMLLTIVLPPCTVLLLYWVGSMGFEVARGSGERWTTRWSVFKRPRRPNFATGVHHPRRA